MDPSSNRNSPRQQNPNNQYSPRAPNFSLNSSDPSPYYPQNLQNPQIPPTYYSQQFSHHSPIYPHYGQPSGFDSTHGYQHPQYVQPQFFPSSHSPNFGSPVERNISQELPSSGRDSTPTSVEDDIQVMVQPPSDFSDSVSRRQWSNKEDEALISCFLNNSEDPIVGTNQQSTNLWGKIHKAYMMLQRQNPASMNPRNLESLRGRYRRLSSAISQWVGCYEQASRRRCSGMSEDDVITEAMTIYSSDYKKKHFAYMHQWLKLKETPRWSTFCPGLSKKSHGSASSDTNSTGKRNYIADDFDLNFDQLNCGDNEEESVPETPAAAPSQPSRSRPQGRQAAKKARGKTKVVENSGEDSAALQESLNRMVKEKNDTAMWTAFSELQRTKHTRELDEMEKFMMKNICKHFGFDAGNN